MHRERARCLNRCPSPWQSVSHSVSESVSQADERARGFEVHRALSQCCGVVGEGRRSSALGPLARCRHAHLRGRCVGSSLAASDLRGLYFPSFVSPRRCVRARGSPTQDFRESCRTKSVERRPTTIRPALGEEEMHP